MNDQTPNAQTPAQEDPAVHRALATLPAFGPATWFEDRVMSRVRRPLPPWLKQALAGWRHYVESGRIYGVVGALAVGSLLPATAALLLASTFREQIGDGVAWFFSVGVPYVGAHIAADVAEVASEVNTMVGALFPSTTVLAAAAAGSVVMLAGCAWGLYRTMNVRGAVRLSRYETN
jgi:hypothetical protein